MTLDRSSLNKSYLRISLGNSSFRHGGLGASMLTRSVGTKLYAAPEQLAGSKYDHKSDIFSLVITMYRLFINTYTQMETLKLIESVRSGDVRQSFTDYFTSISGIFKKGLDIDPAKRPELEEIEKALLKQQLEAFHSLKFSNPSDKVAAIFGSSDNKFHIGQKMSIVAAEINVEFEAGWKPCRLMMMNEELLVFLAEEGKCRLCISMKEYVLILHARKKAVSLKNTMRVDIHLRFQSTSHFELLISAGQDLGCQIY